MISLNPWNLRYSPEYSLLKFHLNLNINNTVTDITILFLSSINCIRFPEYFYDTVAHIGQKVVLSSSSYFKTTPSSLKHLNQSQQPIRPRDGAQSTGKTTPFSRLEAYNWSTTQQPVICQFRGNDHFISPVL